MLEEVEQLGPVREAVLGRDRLGGVARQRDRALRATSRRAAPPARAARSPAPRRPSGARRRATPFAAVGKPPALALVDAQQQRVVLGVERERLVVVARRRPAVRRRSRVDAPAVDVVELAGREQPRARGARSPSPSASRSVSSAAHSPTHVARARAQRAPGVLERVARRGVQRCRRAPTARARSRARRPARWCCPRTPARRRASALPASSAAAAPGTRPRAPPGDRR